MSTDSSLPNAPGLEQLMAETRELFQALSQASSQLIQDSGITLSMRGVLEQLHPDQALTVPDIARARQVTRQHIQTIVNELLQRELVQAEANPAHKRSPLIRLTPLGTLTYKLVLSREQKMLQALAGKLEESRLRQAAETLHELASLIRSGDMGEQRS